MAGEHYAGAELGMGRPTCPSCGSEKGMLGTQYAYFVCHEPDCPGKAKTGFSEQYWQPVDKEHSWNDAVEASPWGKARRERERGAA
jgi:hypothetical protein